MTEEEIIYKKVGEWEEKGSRKQLKNRIDNWLIQFDENEKKEMLMLLYHFDYYSSNKISQLVIELYDKFCKTCQSNDVVFTKIEKEIGTSFSSVFFLGFWYHNNLYDYTQESISQIINRDDIPHNIVFVDDYFGSGKTFISYISKLINEYSQLKNKDFYFIAQQGSLVGKKSIEEFAKTNHLNLTLIVNKYSKKAFEYGSIYSSSNADRHRLIYSNIYDKRGGNAKFKFGFEQIEALVSFYYNTPNNTLGLFWQNLSDFTALFSRHKKKSTTLNNMKKKTIQNNEMKLRKSFREDIESPKLESFMVYCIIKNKSFDVYEACQDFGLTEKQLAEMLTYLVSNNYIKFENGKYIPTTHLEKYLISSKLKDFKKIYQNNFQNDFIQQKEDTYIPRSFKDKFSGYEK